MEGFWKFPILKIQIANMEGSDISELNWHLNYRETKRKQADTK